MNILDLLGTAAVAACILFASVVVIVFAAMLVIELVQLGRPDPEADVAEAWLRQGRHLGDTSAMPVDDELTVLIGRWEAQQR